MYTIALSCHAGSLEGSRAKTLKTAFKCACDGKGEFVLISGYAGTGKTMLINEILKPIAMEKGYYAYGKFDQLRKHTIRSICECSGQCNKAAYD